MAGYTKYIITKNQHIDLRRIMADLNYYRSSTHYEIYSFKGAFVERNICDIEFYPNRIGNVTILVNNDIYNLLFKEMMEYMNVVQS